MRIIDSSTLIYCFEHSIALEGTHYVIGDLDEEFEVAELVHGKSRANVELASEIDNYNEAYYLREYAGMLNKYGGYSFTAMRGFGDIAILALVKSRIENFGQPKQASLALFGAATDDIVVITDDDGLRKRIASEFGDTVTVLNKGDLEKPETK